MVMVVVVVAVCVCVRACVCVCRVCVPDRPWQAARFRDCRVCVCAYFTAAFRIVAELSVVSGHLDFHTAPELWSAETGEARFFFFFFYTAPATRWQAASDWREGVGQLVARNTSELPLQLSGYTSLELRVPPRFDSY